MQSNGYWGGICPTTTSISTDGHHLHCQQCTQFYHHLVWEGSWENKGHLTWPHPVHCPPPTSSMCRTPLELGLHPFLLIASRLWAAATFQITLRLSSGEDLHSFRVHSPNAFWKAAGTTQGSSLPPSPHPLGENNLSPLNETQEQKISGRNETLLWCETCRSGLGSSRL